MKISDYVFFKSFIGLAVIFRLMIHFEFIFLYGVRQGSNFNLLSSYHRTNYLLETPWSPHSTVTAFSSKIIDYKFKGTIYILISIMKSKILLEMHFSNEIKNPDLLS